MKKKFRNKELSWLSFNARLLQEAESNEVPLFERIKFLGIYSNNLDEFFRVRVAILKRLVLVIKKDATQIVGDDPAKILKKIYQIVVEQQRKFGRIYKRILNELAVENIHILNENQLTKKQGEYVRSFFMRTVRPKLMPIMLTDKSGDLDDLNDDSIYLAVELFRKKGKSYKYSLIEIPTDLMSRFVQLPDEGDDKFIVLLDDVIRYELRDIFFMFEFDEINAYTIKITRDAELDIDDDISQSYVKTIQQSLEQRKEGNPVRFLYDEQIPKRLLNELVSRLEHHSDDDLIPGGRYHNFKDFMSFPQIEGKDHLRYERLPALAHPDMGLNESKLNIIKKKDILFHFPYHSFDYFIDLLREASIDPQVKSIHMTIYRVARNSSVMNALINALRNGKKVTAVMELQARFDEKNNIQWSNRLKDEGARIIFGVPGVKVHSKLCLISREEGGTLHHYACLGTGNFNEASATVFSDHLLMTSDRRITNEVVKVFDFFRHNYKIGRFNHLLVSPFYMRSRIVRMINNEIRNAKQGKQAYVHIKVNNLVDSRLHDKLYEAKKAGVEVKLNVRGMFSFKPEYFGEKYTIESIGIIDRFLEHSRIFAFCNNGNEKIYISSADLMERNLDRRTEVATPIYDQELKAQLRRFLDLQWLDNTKARILNDPLDNQYKTEGDIKVRSQYAIYDYISSLIPESKPKLAK